MNMKTKRALAATVRKRLERLAADLPAVAGFNDAYEVLKLEAIAVEKVIRDWPIEPARASERLRVLSNGEKSTNICYIAKQDGSGFDDVTALVQYVNQFAGEGLRTVRRTPGEAKSEPL